MDFSFFIDFIFSLFDIYLKLSQKLKRSAVSKISISKARNARPRIDCLVIFRHSSG